MTISTIKAAAGNLYALDKLAGKLYLRSVHNFWEEIKGPEENGEPLRIVDFAVSSVMGSSEVEFCLWVMTPGGRVFSESVRSWPSSWQELKES